MTAPSSVYCNQIWSSCRFYLLLVIWLHWHRISKFLNFFFWIFPCFWLLLKSYHIILKLTAPIGFKTTFSGSQIIFTEKSLWFQMAPTFSSRTSLLNFRFLTDSIVVFIVIRLVVMTCWSPMHDKHPQSLIEAYMSVIIDFSWSLLNIVSVKNLKIIFRNFFWISTNLKVFLNC